MIERSVNIEIKVADEKPIFIVSEVIDSELRIRFIHNFEEAVKYNERQFQLTPNMNLTINFKGTFPDNFIEGV